MDSFSAGSGITGVAPHLDFRPVLSLVPESAHYVFESHIPGSITLGLRTPY